VSADGNSSPDRSVDEILEELLAALGRTASEVISSTCAQNWKRSAGSVIENGVLRLFVPS